MSVFGIAAALSLVFLALPYFVGATIVILVSGRREPDPDGRRTLARYLGAMSFVALFVALFAAFVSVISLTDLIVDKDRGRTQFEQSFDSSTGFTFTSSRSNNDANYRGAMQAGLVTAVAGGVFVFHRRRRDALNARAGFEGSVHQRVDRTAMLTTCFTAALIFFGAAAAGAYGVFRILAPGVAGARDSTLGRQQGVSALLSLGFLAVALAVIFVVHWREAGGDSTLGSALPVAPPAAPATS